MRRQPVSDREKDRAALVELAEVLTAAGCIAFVIWWIWLR